MIVGQYDSGCEILYGHLGNGSSADVAGVFHTLGYFESAYDSLSVVKEDGPTLLSPSVIILDAVLPDEFGRGLAIGQYGSLAKQALLLDGKLITFHWV
jgi:hypothetical protein